MKIVIVITTDSSEQSAHLRKGLYNLVEELGMNLITEPHNTKDEWQILTAHFNGRHLSFEREVDKIFNKLLK